jgi:hypothetical protein
VEEEEEEDDDDGPPSPSQPRESRAMSTSDVDLDSAGCSHGDAVEMLVIAFRGAAPHGSSSLKFNGPSREVSALGKAVAGWGVAGADQLPKPTVLPAGKMISRTTRESRESGGTETKRGKGERYQARTRITEGKVVVNNHEKKKKAKRVDGGGRGSGRGTTDLHTKVRLSVESDGARWIPGSGQLRQRP